MVERMQVLSGKLKQVDILAIGPHPDDVEIGMGGTLLAWRDMGFTFGLVDLTQGELGTKGTAAIRLQESVAAAEFLHAAFRVNMSIADGQVIDSIEHREGLVEVIRHSQAKWIFGNNADSRHPDHAGGYQLLQSAFFLTRLPKYHPTQSAHSPESLFFYLIHELAQPSFLVDISSHRSQKQDLLRCYPSQFVDPQLPDGYRHTGLHDYLRNVLTLNDMWGIQAGYGCAEAFLSHRPLVLTRPPSR